MSYRPTGSLPPGGDTPVDERPPYGDRRRWWPVVAAAVVGVGCAVVLGAVTLMILFVVAAVMIVWRLARPRRRGGVIFMNDYDQPYNGPAYEVRFYDGNYRQLDDMYLSIALRSVHGREADTALARMAEDCRLLVESDGTQRCFSPRVDVLDGFGTVIRTWQRVTR